ncbi:FKBP12-associated protein [Haplosporangium sp. Z 27]|nr:FKBP12-associated protein [Haplosporangium sp. Z 27]
MGSQSSTRRDNTRHNDEAINRSDVTRSATDMNDPSTMHSGSNNSAQRGKRWPRGQKKELAGRTFPSTSASTSSAAEAHQHNSAPRHISKGLPRSPAKFVPKVEEDRDLMEALTIQITTEQDGDVQAAKTPRFLSQRTTPASVAKLTSPSLIDILRPIHVENFVDERGTALIHAIFHAILAHVLHVGVLVLFSHAIVVTKASSFDALKQILLSKAESHASKPLACGHHECTKTCHTLNDEPGLCPARPEAVKTCPCGAKPIESLLMGKERTSCIDHIPVCGGVCKKLLKCGHECMQKCHTGECSPCKTSVTVDCRCGSKHLQLICSEMGIYGDKQPTCQKPCLGLRSCGKHQCTKRCCPAKNQPKGTKLGADVYEAHMPHSKSYHVTVDVLFCIHPLLVVPQSLNASIHARGSVHVVMPPWQAILVTQILSHALLALCLLRSNVCVENQICPVYLVIQRRHRVAKFAAGTLVVVCISATNLATLVNVCRPLKFVLKPVQNLALVISSCKCGNLTKDIVCGATSENPSDGKPRIIKCNDFCLIVERNKRVALALDIDDTTNRGPRIPHFDDYVLDYASANMEFTLKIEKRLEEWVVDSTLQTLNLSPMKGHHRKFVHELASYYNVTSESVDVEPYRSVVIHRKLNTSIPDLLASQACRQKRASSNSVGVSNGGIEQLRKSNIKDPINAIYLHDLVFGLTRTELSARLASIFGNIKYGIRWLTDDDAVLVPYPGNMSMDELEILLVRLRTSIKTLTTDGQLCERVELCWVNKEGEVTSHTSVRQSKHVFNATQGTQLKKAVPPKVRNTFSILDDDERVAAAKKAEEERILKAKEAAGTLSLDAWEEDEGEASFPSSGQKTSQPPSANGAYHSDDSLHMSFKSISSHRKIDQKSFFDAEQNVVDDWQELLDDDDDY